MIVVRSDMTIGTKGFDEEFLLDVAEREFTLRFKTGHEMALDISERTPYGFVHFESSIGVTYSFWINDKTVKKPFYTFTKTTPFDTELRTGFCKKFG